MTGRILPGSEKYLRDQPSPKKTKSMQFIDRVNREVSLQQLLADQFNVYVPSDVVRSWKTYCPWSWEHPDGGVEKTLRVYSSNSAYCFAFHGVLTPVKVMQIQHECGAMAAARWLAETYNLETRRPYWERMAKLVVEHETRTTAGGDLAHAAEALTHALMQVPGYPARQFDEVVIRAVDVELQRLDALDIQPGAVHEWLREAVATIRHSLDT